MINLIIDSFKNLDSKTKSIMEYGFTFSLLFCLFSTLILFTYHSFYTIPIIFTVGTILFKSSLMLFVDFIICGLAFDKIKKEC